MTDAEKKRAYVAGLYSAPGWKRRVANMPDNRITAIFLEHQGAKKPEFDKHPNIDPEAQLDIPPSRRDPHANEDEFEMY